MWSPDVEPGQDRRWLTRAPTANATTAGSRKTTHAFATVKNNTIASTAAIGTALETSLSFQGCGGAGAPRSGTRAAPALRGPSRTLGRGSGRSANNGFRSLRYFAVLT